jgi:hypothetical protein
MKLRPIDRDRLRAVLNLIWVQKHLLVSADFDDAAFGRVHDLLDATEKELAVVLEGTSQI